MTDDGSTGPYRYPESRRSDHVDVIHGVSVPDPYRWLEEVDSEETRAWIEAQNELTFGYLGKIGARERIRRRMTELWDYEKFDVPRREGGSTSSRGTTGCRVRASCTAWPHSRRSRGPSSTRTPSPRTGP